MPHQQSVEPRFCLLAVSRGSGKGNSGQIGLDAIRRKGKGPFNGGSRAIAVVRCNLRQSATGEDLSRDRRRRICIRSGEVLQHFSDAAAADVCTQKKCCPRRGIEAALEGRAGFPLRCLAIAHLDAETCERNAKPSIRGRRAYCIAQLDLGGAQIAPRLRRLSAPLGCLGSRRWRLILRYGGYWHRQGSGKDK
jgi:hypothetical protein